MTANLVPLYKRAGYTETFNRCWNLVETIRGEGRCRMYAEIRIYKRKNRYSYGCGYSCGPPDYRGFGMGCRGDTESYPSAKDATAAAVECLKKNLGNKDYRNEILSLLPAAEPQLSLFGGGPCT